MDRQQVLEKETGKRGSLSIEQYSKYEIHGLGRDKYIKMKGLLKEVSPPFLLNFV